MPTKQDFKDNKDIVLGEASGCLFVVFMCGIVRMTTTDPFTCGAVVFMTYAMAKYSNYKFSKAHFNPAVSIAYYIMDEIKSMQCVIYVASQLAGSVAAGILLMVLYWLGVSTTGVGAGCPWKGTFKYKGVDTDTAGYFQSKKFKYFPCLTVC
jgi:glycerol uptake facilitator-like aquaporin